MKEKDPEVDLKDFIDFINTNGQDTNSVPFNYNDDKIEEKGIGFTTTGDVYIIYKSEVFESTILQSSIKDKILEIIKKMDGRDDEDKSHEIGCDTPLHICGSESKECFGIDTFIKNKLTTLLNDIDSLENEHPDKYIKDYFLGFYKPVHFYKESWGIYMIVDGLARGVRRLRNFVNSNNRIFSGNTIEIEQAYNIRMAFTFFHEYYHHKIEALSVKFEMLYRKPFYTKGFHCLYCNTYGTDECIEEAFAHAYAYYRTIQFFKDQFETFDITFLKNILKNGIIKNSPAGYRMAYGLVSGSENDKNNLEHQFLEILLQFSCKANGIDYLPEMNIDFWKFFTYGLDPLINKDNNVTFVVSADATQNEYFSDFFSST